MMSRLANPVLVQELRGRMRGSRAFVILTIYLLVLAAVVTLIYMAAASSVSTGTPDAGRTIGKALFIGTAFFALLQVMVIVPSQAANAIASEKERQTYDLLILTLMPPWKIVLGKLMAALAYALLLIVSVIPFMALSFLFGGVTGLEVALALVGLLATAFLFGALGIFWSTIMRRTMPATTTTAATMLALLFGIPLLAFTFSAVLIYNSGIVPRWAGHIAFVYAWMMVMALHPFVALGISEVYLSQGETRVFFPVEDNPQQIYLPVPERFSSNFLIPHPWLLFTIEALVIGGLLIWLSIRMLKPLNEGVPKRKRRG